MKPRLAESLPPAWLKIQSGSVAQQLFIIAFDWAKGAAERLNQTF